MLGYHVTTRAADEIKRYARQSLLEAWKEMLDTWQTQKSNPTYAFDTPVPENSKNTNKLPSKPKSAIWLPKTASLGLRQLCLTIILHKNKCIICF